MQFLKDCFTYQSFLWSILKRDRRAVLRNQILFERELFPDNQEQELFDSSDENYEFQLLCKLGRKNLGNYIKKNVLPKTPSIKLT